MRNFYLRKNLRSLLTFSILLFSIPNVAEAQQLKISDFVIFGGGPASGSSGRGVNLSPATNIINGRIGSYGELKTTGNSSIGGNLHSGGTINLANSNTVGGNITVGNSAGLTGNVLLIGSSVSVSGNIDVNGNTLISGGRVLGKVTHPQNTTYSGPAPGGGIFKKTPAIPTLPAMPDINVFQAAGTTSISNNKIITPGKYNKLTLGGNKTITLSGVGTYVFSEIMNSGSANTFVFDFKNNPTGVFRIYVHGDINLNKVKGTIVNGGSETRIYTETHGNGSTSSTKLDAFTIANGSSGSASKWLGMVWVPYASINIGSGTGSSDILGSLWSNQRVTVQSGVTIRFSPFQLCITPEAKAGPDKVLNCAIGSLTLEGNSSASNVQYSWQALDGGIISAGQNTATPTVVAAGTYILTVTATGGCSAADETMVTFDPCIFPEIPALTDGRSEQTIGSELNSLFLNYNSADSLSENVFIISGESVYVEVISRLGQTASLQTLLTGSDYGLTNLISNGPNSLLITGKYPIANLLKLDSLPTMIEYVRPLFPPLGNSGITFTQGDLSMRSDFVRNGYGVFGEEVKVGVLSDSYNTVLGNNAQTDVANGDLPGPQNAVNNDAVNILKEYPFGRRTDEGRAMLQIVHDIAPKAKLAFRTGFISVGDFALGIKQLQQDNCDIIVDDITFITEPFFQDGVVAKAVDEVTASGVSYFSAAGNYGNKSYQSLFREASVNTGTTGKAHDFSNGNNDIFQNISLKPGPYTIVLQWEDEIYSLGQSVSGTVNDLDIYLSDNNGATLFGLNRNNLGGDPLEILSFNVTQNTTSNILIKRFFGTGNVTFKYLIFRGEPVINEYNAGTSTIVGQANALGAMAIGALLYTNTPAFGGVPSMASFSSVGGTPVNGIVRNKPDFAAPNGVNTTVNLGGSNIDNDSFPNFFGTSAAAPHAAAAAALIINARKKFTGVDLSPEQLRTLLIQSAFDIVPSGFDPVAGYGFIQPNVAIRKFATPNPFASELILPSATVKPGEEEFIVTVKGDFLDPNSSIWFRDKALTTTFISSTELKAVIPAFGKGNPPIYVKTPPISSSLKDGGISDTLYFFSPVKKKIVVTAENKIKKYGEQLPDFTASVLVDSVPLQSTNFTLQELGLDSIIFSSPAVNLSNSGNYVIKAFINPLDSANADNIALLEFNTYTFNSGILTIQKLPLKITPKDTTLTYGEKIGDFKYAFEYDDQNVFLTDKSLLRNLLSESYTENLADAIALVDARAVVNNRVLVNSDLENLSFLVSARAVVNARQLINARAVVNSTPAMDTTNIVDVAVESIFNYQDDPVNAILVSARQLVNARAVVNARALINGTATLNARQLINGSQLINSSTVENTLSEVVVIVDSEDYDAPAGDQLTDFKSINLVTGITAGHFVVVPGALISSNFDITYGLGNLNILPATLEVKAEDKLIFKGSALPVFTSVISGFQYNESLTVASGPQYHLSPAYEGLAGVYAIIPENLIFNPADINYQNIYIPGKLYVNPKGKGTRKIKPYLNCVEVLTNHPSGFKYVAHFSYTNDNPTLVYVPVGPDNNLLTAGSYSGKQPTEFIPGGGSFDIYFDGSKLTWTVKSYEVNLKTSVASEASSTSSRCNDDLLTSSLLMSSEKPLPALTDYEKQGKWNENKSSVYPNPVSDIITVEFKEISDQDVRLTDVNGRRFDPQSVRKVSDGRIKIDVTNLLSGIYFMRIRAGNEYKMFRFIKM